MEYLCCHIFRNINFFLAEFLDPLLCSCKNLLDQWFPTLGPQISLDYNSQKLAELARISESCDPRTSGGTTLGTTGTGWNIQVGEESF